MKLAKTILIWFIGILFIATGFLKLTHLDPMSAGLFSKADYPYWLFYAAGTFELLGGIGLLLLKTRPYGAAMLAIVMVGAISTHVLVKDDFVHLIVPALLLVFLVSLVMKFKE